MGKRGDRYRPCWKCRVEINYTFTEMRGEKRIFHWREKSGEIHHCKSVEEKYDDVMNKQHLRSIMRE